MNNNSFTTSRLTSGRYVGVSAEGIDADPMPSLANLFEVMLVFAVAMLIFGFISGTQSSEVSAEQTGGLPVGAQQIEEKLTPAANSAGGEGNTYSEVGTVYVDQATGEYYVVAKQSDSSSVE